MKTPLSTCHRALWLFLFSTIGSAAQAQTTPANQPTNLIFSPVGQDNITLNFTGGGSEKYLILRGLTGYSITPPVDGVGYSTGAFVGTSQVIYSGSSTSFQDVGLSSVYYYTIYAYNGSGNAVAYQTNNPLQGSQSVGGGTFYSRQTGNYNDPNTWSLISPTGPPADVAAGVDETSTIEINSPDVVTMTSNQLGFGMTIKAGAVLDGAGYTLNIANFFVVYGNFVNGNAGVSQSYSVAIGGDGIKQPVFNNVAIGDNGYLTLNTDIVVLGNYIQGASVTLVDNGYAIYPCVPPSQSPQDAVYTNQLGNSMTLGWTRGNGSGGVLVIARESGTSQVKPDFKVYAANATFGSGDETMPGSKNYVVYRGTGNSVDITGLKPNTYYEFGVYEFNGTNCYNISNFLGASDNSGTPPIITAVVTPNDAATNVDINTNITFVYSRAIRNADNSAITNANAAGAVIFKLTGPGGANVPFVATFDNALNKITIDPTSSLLSNQKYYVEVKNVEDVNDNAAPNYFITFTTQSVPVISDVKPSVPVCEADATFYIEGNNFGSSVPTVTVNSLPAIVSEHSQTSITITAGLSPGGTLVVTNNDNQLSTTYAKPLLINPPPQLFNVTGGGIYCSDTPGVKIGLSNSQTGVAYELYLGSNFTKTSLDGTGAALDFGLVTAQGSYSVKATSKANCKQDMTGTVAVSIKPAVLGTGVIGSSAKSLCVGESTAFDVSGITNADSYTWTLPAEVEATPVSTSSSITVKAVADGAGAKIAVAGLNACGTGTPVSTSIDINSKPKASIEGPAAQKQIVNDDLEFTAVIENTDNFVSTIWDFGNGSTADIPTASSRYESTGNYTVMLTVKDGNGCGDEAQYPLTIIEFPSLISSSIKNVVTANGDGKNDLLIVSDIDRFPTNHVTVLDRWGIEVFSQDNYMNDWNFTKGSAALPAGNYVCIVKLGSETVITRNITLIQK